MYSLCLSYIFDAELVKARKIEQKEKEFREIDERWGFRKERWGFRKN